MNLEIIAPFDGTGDVAGLALRRFLNPGTLKLGAGRKTPSWLPHDPRVLYAGEGGDLYALTSDIEGGYGAPRKVGDLADVVLGRALLQRYAAKAEPGFVFGTDEAPTLARCLEDDTEVDLPAEEAERLVREGKPIVLPRAVLTYALLEAVRTVGRNNARLVDGERPWTLRRIFGEVR